MKDQGISHIELIDVVALVGVLTAAAAFEYNAWVKKVAAERVTKVLYSDMMHARMMAVTKGRKHYIVLGNTVYSVIEDTSDSGSKDNGDKMFPIFRSGLR